MLSRTHAQTGLFLLAAALFGLVLPACQVGLTLDEEGLTGSIAGEFEFDGQIKIEVEVGSGVLATETRDVGLFDEIETHGSCSVEVTIGDGPALEISGDDNLLKYWITEVVGGRLVVRTQGAQTVSPTLPVIIRATVPDVSFVETHGSGDVAVAELDNAGIRLITHGSSGVQLAGVTDFLDIVVHGASDVDANALTARSGVLVVHGSGVADVYAFGTLDLTVHGSGTIRYAGEAAVTQHVYGSGSITKTDG